jgi:uncharacterized C2H2 Zn-finger protein
MRSINRSEYEVRAPYLNPKERYRLYLSTTHWIKVRNTVHLHYKYKCNHCNKPVGLSKSNVHHLNYDHQWEEDPGKDVILLCRRCHAKVHNIKEMYKCSPVNKSHSHKRVKSKKELKRIPLEEFKNLDYATMRMIIQNLESKDPTSKYKYNTQLLNEMLKLFPTKKDYITNLMYIKRQPTITKE